MMYEVSKSAKPAANLLKHVFIRGDELKKKYEIFCIV